MRRSSPRSPRSQLLLVLLLAAFTRAQEAADLNDAVKLEQTDAVRALLSAGANVNVTDSLGWTPLHNAAYTGQADMVRVLLMHQANPDTPEPVHGRSSLHLAAYSGHAEVVSLLLDAGATIDLRDEHGQSALHLGVWRGQVGVVATLLQREAQVDAQDDRGSTPIMLAAIQDTPEVTRELLPYCPDLRIPNKQGQNVMQYVKKGNLTRMQDIVLEHLQRPCRRSVLQMVPASPSKTSTVEGKECPAGEKKHPDDDAPHRWWLPTTPVGKSVGLPCPSGNNGSATWTCGRDGVWQRTADLSHCRAVVFSGWQGVVTMENISAAKTMKDVALSLESVTLAAGDLITLSLILKRLSEKHTGNVHPSHTPLQTFIEAQHFVQGLTAVVDMMLSRPSAWWGLPQDQMAVSLSHIQTSLASAALTLAAFQKTPVQELSQDTLYVKVVQQPPAYFSPASHRTFSHPEHNHTALTLPPRFYQGYAEHLNTVKVAFVSYSNLHCIFNSLPCDAEKLRVAVDLPAYGQINGAILGASVGADTIWHAPLGMVAEVNFQHVYDGDSFRLHGATCVWWDEHAVGWATDGCRLVLTSPTHTVCHCNHLANMAVMMDVEGPMEKSRVMDNVMKCVIVVGCVVSVATLALCVFCLLILKDMRGKTSKVIQANLCLCLVATELVVLGSLGASGKPGPCAAIVAVFHYLTLTTFIWSAIEAVHNYVSGIKGKAVGRWVMRCCPLVAYLVPLLYVAAIHALTSSLAHHTHPECRLSPRSLGWTVASPLATIVLVNVVALMMSGRDSCCHKGKKETKTTGHSFCSSFSVFLLLCFTWITGLLYFIEGSHEAALVFTILNFLLGVSILFLQIIMEQSGAKQ
ncbi:adhesion G protein-coupled receptor L4-like isoform X2 [Eriocheir sinensis]|uniref:adhesion G protein-coupled receptor L4-like isoform X2 n=1 Tax=Eriocheir sinensis TaxID=95602 RepID=UPI0021C7AD6C|nr:adhesion G protein-coupled receptor L4-like isoform X2 [Eriocheir sinensis]